MKQLNLVLILIEIAAAQRYHRTPLKLPWSGLRPRRAPVACAGDAFPIIHFNVPYFVVTQTEHFDSQGIVKHLESRIATGGRNKAVYRAGSVFEFRRVTCSTRHLDDDNKVYTFRGADYRTLKKSTFTPVATDRPCASSFEMPFRHYSDSKPIVKTNNRTFNDIWLPHPPDADQAPTWIAIPVNTTIQHMDVVMAKPVSRLFSVYSVYKGLDQNKPEIKRIDEYELRKYGKLLKFKDEDPKIKRVEFKHNDTIKTSLTFKFSCVIEAAYEYEMKSAAFVTRRRRPPPPPLVFRAGNDTDEAENATNTEEYTSDDTADIRQIKKPLTKRMFIKKIMKIVKLSAIIVGVLALAVLLICCAAMLRRKLAMRLVSYCWKFVNTPCRRRGLVSASGGGCNCGCHQLPAKCKAAHKHRNACKCGCSKNAPSKSHHSL